VVEARLKLTVSIWFYLSKSICVLPFFPEDQNSSRLFLYLTHNDYKLNAIEVEVPVGVGSGFVFTHSCVPFFLFLLYVNLLLLLIIPLAVL
jgi:hypothetical protein